jgi:3D (Asp-Asp-Asp) domain-containing protein
MTAQAQRLVSGHLLPIIIIIIIAGMILAFTIISNVLAKTKHQNTQSQILQQQPRQQCSKGWYITGYFIPSESDYNGSKKTIDISPINDTDKVIRRSFYSSFLTDVEIEGWGRSIEDDYIGLVTPDKQWHSSPKPTAGTGDFELKKGIVAVDPNIIGLGKKLTIPSLPSPWNSQVFTAGDVGPNIKEEHIDVFTGEGKISNRETFRITSDNNTVCLLSHEQ